MKTKQTKIKILILILMTNGQFDGSNNSLLLNDEFVDGLKPKVTDKLLDNEIR